MSTVSLEGGRLVVSIDPADFPGLRETLDRAMRTWEPSSQASVAQLLSEGLDKATGTFVEPYNARVKPYAVR